MASLSVHAPSATRSSSSAGASKKGRGAGNLARSEHHMALATAWPPHDVKVAAAGVSAPTYKAIQIFREPGLAMTEAFRANGAASTLLELVLVQRLQHRANDKSNDDGILGQAEFLAAHACANAANATPKRYTYGEALNPVACKLLSHFTLAEILATRGGVANREKAVENLCLALQAASAGGLSTADQQRFVKEHGAKVNALLSDAKVQAMLPTPVVAPAIDGARVSLLSRLQDCFARLYRQFGVR